MIVYQPSNFLLAFCDWKMIADECGAVSEGVNGVKWEPFSQRLSRGRELVRKKKMIKCAMFFTA